MKKGIRRPQGGSSSESGKQGSYSLVILFAVVLYMVLMPYLYNYYLELEKNSTADKISIQSEDLRVEVEKARREINDAMQRLTKMAKSKSR